MHLPKPPAQPDLAKGQAIATQVCAACHAVDGSRGSPANPILAGQHPSTSSSSSPSSSRASARTLLVQGFASMVSEADMKNVAAFYASKQAKPGFAKATTPA